MAKETVIEQVKMVQVGQNLNITLGEKKFTIKGTKEELTPIKEAIKKYQEKPTKVNKEAMLKFVQPRTTEVAEMKSRIKADKKKTEREIKDPTISKVKATASTVIASIEEKEYSQKELEDMERAIQKAKEKKASAPVSKVAPETRQRRGEY